MEKLKTYTQEELNEILENHKKWLIDNNQGNRAYLSGADLRGANLIGAYLSGADLRGANLIGADFYEADLYEADLREAYLNEADLRRANLSRANLIGVDLSEADLRRANLYEADLSGADLRGADLREVDLRRANLRGVDLSEADLREADLRRANLYEADLRRANLYEADLKEAYLRRADLREAKNIPFIPMACPDEGEFIGWKKAYIENHKALVKLKILEDSKRSSATGRKCRTDKAFVLSIIDLKENKECSEAISDYDNDFKYTVGEIVSVPNFDDNRFNECAPGIHFFINKEEALNY